MRITLSWFAGQLFFMASLGRAVVLFVSFTDGSMSSFKIRHESHSFEDLFQSIASVSGIDVSSIEKIEFYNAVTGKYDRLSTIWDLGKSRSASILVTCRNASAETSRLMIKGRLYSDDGLTIGNIGIRINEDGVGRANDGTGLVTWDASVVLGKFLELNAEKYLRGKNVLELGAGTGLVGIIAAILGADHVLLTDLQYALENLGGNVAAHSLHFPDSTTVEVAELDWFRRETYTNDTWNTILCADVIWLESLVPAFVATLSAVSQRAGTTILLAHQSRTQRTDELLFGQLAGHGFTVEKVDKYRLHPSYDDPKISIFECSRRPSDQLPDGFVYLDSDYAPGIRTSLRYATKENFCGAVIDGYEGQHRVIITKDAAQALKMVAEFVGRSGYDLVIYDAYRPQRAVDHFIRWSSGDQKVEEHVKGKYFPGIDDKSKLFELGYIAKKSGHSRGSTVDVTIIHKQRRLLEVDELQLAFRTSNAGTSVPFLDDGTVDMFSSFDLFNECSRHDSDRIPKESLASRNYLREAMQEHGFRPLADEWWHYTLIDEAFPDVYFNF